MTVNSPTAEFTNVGYYIQSIMNKNGWSLRDVANRAAKLKRPFSHEHLRKIILGNTSPSLDLLERLAEALGVPATDLTEIQLRSNVTRKYGREYLESMELTPELFELDNLIRLLTPEQKQFIMSSIRSLVQGNAKQGTLKMPTATRRRKRA